MWEMLCKTIFRWKHLEMFLIFIFGAEHRVRSLTAYGTLTGLPIFPPEWVFEPWLAVAAEDWRNGPGLQDIALEQMAAMKSSMNSIFACRLYAEGAGATFLENIKRGIIQSCIVWRTSWIQGVSWQFPNMTQELAQELLPECPKEELPITRNKMMRKKNFRCISISPIRVRKSFWQHSGRIVWMQVFVEVWLTLEMLYRTRQFFMMEDAAMRCITRMPISMRKNYRELFEQKYGDDHVLYTRGAAPGSQHFACQFGGDQLTSFQGLKYAIAGGLSAAASGLPFWGVDAGGYDGFPDQETYLRWTEYAAFCPLMRFHGTEPREPWEYDAFTVKVYRYYTWLRENLRPYIVSVAAEAHKLGIPMMRPLAMMYPEDQEATKVWDEYLFGEDLLVAPVSDETEEREIYFPEGRWISLWNLNEKFPVRCRGALRCQLIKYRCTFEKEVFFHFD